MNTERTQKTANPLTRKQGLLRRMTRAVRGMARQMIVVMTAGLTTAATILHHPRTRNIVSLIIVAAFLGGMTVFTHSADFSKTGWQNAYYLWEKGLWVLALILVYSNIWKEFKLLAALTIVYTIARLCIQIITIIKAIDTNADKVVNILYLTLVSIFVIQSIKEIRNAWKQ